MGLLDFLFGGVFEGGNDSDSYYDDESRNRYEYREPLDNYGCSRCGTVVQSSHSPVIPGCPCGGDHHWYNISEVGPEPYQCSRCGMVVYSSHYPRYCVCRFGGDHHWVKLV